MALSVTSSTTTHLTVDRDGTTSVCPRVWLNREYRELLGATVQDVSRDSSQYEAFPAQQIINGYIVVTFSDGDAHADSDRQIMCRKAVSDMYDTSAAWSRVVFYEDDSATYDLTLLDDILTDGETVTFKAWVVEKSGGVTSGQIVNSVVVSGYSDPDIDGTYALWSPVREYSGSYYRTGYRTDAAGWNTVLFESADQVSWAVKGVIAQGHGSSLEYNEADIVETTTGNYLAVVREETGAGRPLYTTTSSDLITWSAPTLSSDFEGTQPCLLKQTDGDIFLAVGDRTQQTGFDAGGFPTSYVDTTGIQIYLSEDNAVSWSSGTMLAKSWSTDCGQPVLAEPTANVVSVVYYNATGPTNSVTEPGIAHKIFTSGNVV